MENKLFAQLAEISGEERKVFGEKLRLIKMMNSFTNEQLGAWPVFNDFFPQKWCGSQKQKAFLCEKMVSRLLSGSTKVGMKTLLGVCYSMEISDLDEFLRLGDKELQRFNQQTAERAEQKRAIRHIENLFGLKSKDILSMERHELLKRLSLASTEA